MPCATSPPQRFSLKLMTANPTICAQQPASAAPPASPVRLNAAQIAALLIGSVSAIPTSTDTMIPMRNGCSSVAHMIALPTPLATKPMPGPHQRARPIPTNNVTKGVTRISIFVSLETALPNSAAKIVTISTASGPPAPATSDAFAAVPTAASENRTSGGACKASPIATAIAAPVAAFAYPPIVTSSSIPACSPSVERIVPIKRDANKPCAIADSASMP